MDAITTTRPIEDADGLPPGQRRLAMLAQSVGLAISVLAAVIVNIALPSVAVELNATPADSIWIVNAYQMAMVVTLLPSAALGDIIGYRKVFIWGVVVFTVASAACALAGSLPTLVIARILQGMGSAGINSVNTALIRFIFPRAKLGRGVAVSALTVATCSASGPPLAAAILAVASWKWLFLLNVPFGLFAIWQSLKSLPHTPRSGHRFDWISAILNTGTFGLLLIGLNGIGHGESMRWVTLELLAGSAFCAAFIRRQHRLTNPMLPVDLFRRPIFALSVATAVCSYAGQTIAYLALPFYFAIAGGLSQTHIGLLITPWPAIILLIAPIAGRLSDKHPAGLLGGLGLLTMGIGLVLVLGIPPSPNFADVTWRMMICGAGFGFFQAPNNRALISAAPRSRSGVASGVLSTARQTGQTLGGVVVAVTFGFLADDIGRASHIAIGVAAGFAAFGCVISFLRLTQRPVSGD